MKKLCPIRHAKSSWKDLNLEDIERPLNERGKRDAPEIGSFLKNKKLFPDLIMSSPANRALTTAKKIAKKLDFPIKDIAINRKLYVFSSSGDSVIEVLQKVDDRFETVFIFGHNPTFTALANRLTGQWFDNVPTCGVVSILFDTPHWATIERENAKLDFYMFPKMLD